MNLHKNMTCSSSVSSHSHPPQAAQAKPEKIHTHRVHESRPGLRRTPAKAHAFATETHTWHACLDYSTAPPAALLCLAHALAHNAQPAPPMTAPAPAVRAQAEHAHIRFCARTLPCQHTMRAPLATPSRLRSKAFPRLTSCSARPPAPCCTWTACATRRPRGSPRCRRPTPAPRPPRSQSFSSG